MFFDIDIMINGNARMYLSVQGYVHKGFLFIKHG